jgi:isopenicillin N synthase-like dioxygenase
MAGDLSIPVIDVSPLIADSGLNSCREVETGSSLAGCREVESVLRSAEAGSVDAGSRGDASRKSSVASGTGSLDGVSSEALNRVARQIREACCDNGFFYISGHGVSVELQQRLEELSRKFFALDLETKMAIRMELGGRAWRGYFPVGVEYTSGKPDKKEGIYFGAELPDSHPKVQARVPMHGRNLFPELPQFKETVLEYLDAMVALGHSVMKGIALSLGLKGSYFRDRYTDDPLILFRIFHYPSVDISTRGDAEQEWSVGEHTDYGILTILRQDAVAGLQVKSQAQWIDAPPIANTFICNIGDMLDRMTGGLYRSTPHRVLNKSGVSRMSFPFFFDPNFDVEVKAINPDITIQDDKLERWDRASVHEFSGTYGEYVLNKVSKVFPQLSKDAL